MVIPKIDKRKHYVLVIDTETTLPIGRQIVYDMGWSVIDTKGNVYKERSYINIDVFGNPQLMAEAFYSYKCTNYLYDIANQSRQLATFFDIRNQMLADMAEYGITEVCFHNAPFDVKALNNTMAFLTDGKYNHFFRKGTIVWCSLKMARQLIATMPTYKLWCEIKGELTEKQRKPKTTAESLYRFISCSNDFIESHTALEDVQIEREILWYCLNKHKKLDKVQYIL